MVDTAGGAALGFRGFRRAAVLFWRALTLRCVLAEGVLVLLVVVTLIATWPRVPWSLLQYGAPVAMILTPIFLYPFSRLIWLAFDLMLRPVVPNDLAAPPTTR